MAKVKSPLFSEKATGTIGDTITFRCGKYVTAKQKDKGGIVSIDQNAQRQKFIEAADVWTKFLTDQQKEAWQTFSRNVKDPRGYFKIGIPGQLFMLIRTGEKDYQRCIEFSNFNGYQYFLSAYLTLGAFGWVGYPNPPELG